MSDQPINHLDGNLLLADDALLAKAASWQSAGHRLALAFVIHTWGSSPRQVGSLMLVREDSQIAGSVSGGCVEGAVIDAALEIIKTGGSQRLDFGVADATAWEVGLSCGAQRNHRIAIGSLGRRLARQGHLKSTGHCDDPYFFIGDPHLSQRLLGTGKQPIHNAFVPAGNHNDIPSVIARDALSGVIDTLRTARL